MPLGPGSIDLNGIYQYGEDDAETLASDLLNLGQQQTSITVGQIHDRLDDLEAVTTTDYVDLRRTAALNVTTSFAGFAWDTEVADTNGWHSTSTNPARVTVDKAGLYMVTMNLELDSTSAAIQALISKNGTGLAHAQVTDVGGGSNSRAFVVVHERLNAGDYLSVAAITGSGTVPYFVSRCFLQVRRVAA